MIVGIGTDIVNIERIENIYKKHGDSFLKKNFHPLEIAQFTSLSPRRQIGFLAKRFAAKEAVSKAFGTGIGGEFAFCDIATINNENGAPEILISPGQKGDVDEYDIQISLSDDYPFAVAFVVISK